MVEFVSYDGSYPNLCTGKTILKINGETVILPPYSLTSGGYFLVDEDRTESVCKGLWSVDLPEELEQYRRETSVITQKRIFKYNAVLRDLYEEVDSRFYMCHRSYIINFDYVDLMENQSIFMSNGTQITICRANYQRTKKEFVQYLKKE